MKNGVRTALMATVAIVATACAHGGNSQALDSSWTTAQGPMCEVRVENGYGTPIEAGVIVGARELSLGLVDEDEKRAFDVPCSYRAVTVFRVVRASGLSESRLGQRAQVLDPDGTTVVTLRPSVVRSVHRPGY